MKKLISLILAFAMVFSLAMPAMAAEDTRTIYFENTGNWSAVYAYAWDESTAYLSDWPGSAMTKVEGETNIYSIEVSTAAINVIFNDGSTQTDDLTIPTDGNDLYSYGTGAWSKYAKKNGDVTASYDPTITIDGVTISDNADYPGVVSAADNTYTITIPADQTEVAVNIIVSGQNLDKIPADNYNYAVAFGETAYTILASEYDPNTGNAVMSVMLYADYIGTTDLQYSTDSGITWVDTGWDVVVQQAATEPEPTEVSLSVKLKAVDSTGAEITDLLNASLDGVGVTNGAITECGPLLTGDYTMTWFVIPSGYQTPADISLTVTDDGSGNGILTSSNAGVELVDGVYVITVTLEKETTEPEATAKITGATVYVNEVEQPMGNVIITEGDTVKVVFKGENFDKLTNAYTYSVGFEGGNFGSGNTYVTVDAENNTATLSYAASSLINASRSSIKYTNAGESETETGYTLTYLEKGTQLTNIYFKNTAGWTAPRVHFLDSKGYQIGDAELKLVGGESDIYSAAVPESDWIYQVEFLDNATPGSATGFKTIPTDGSDQYNYDDGTWTEFKATEHTTTSANIVWGSMAFTYTDGENGAEGAWSNDVTGGGTVTVTNTGTTTFTAQVAYNPETDYTEIEGSFDAASAELAAEASKTFTLTLKNQPAKAITAGTKIGSVTITFN